jgi:hypothetical protein
MSQKGNGKEIMNGVIAKQTNDFFACLSTPVFERKKTSSCVSNALSTLKDYKYYRQIKEDEYKQLKKEIKSAPNDDAVSNIMTKLRKRVYS